LKKKRILDFIRRRVINCISYSISERVLNDELDRVCKKYWSRIWRHCIRVLWSDWGKPRQTRFTI